jgi:hypothetical protein
MPNPQPNVTNIPSNRVEIVDSKTGMVSREWYRFFLNLFTLAGSGGNQISLDDLQLGPPPQPATASVGTGTVTSVDVSGGTTGLTTSGGPVITSGTITLAGTLAIANGGTGQTTQASAFNALSPITTVGDLILGNGANSATRLAIGTNGYVLTSNGTTASWVAGGGSGATITNDTTTATNVFPVFANATSGSFATAFTSNTNYLYKPSTGELTALAQVSSNGIQINANTVATSYTIATGNNGLSAGPVSVNSGITVTVSSGSTWVVV